MWRLSWLRFAATWSGRTRSTRCCWMSRPGWSQRSPPTAACSREKTASEWPWVPGVQTWGKGSPGPNAEYRGEGISPEVVIVQMKGGALSQPLERHSFWPWALSICRGTSWPHSPYFSIHWFWLGVSDLCLCSPQGISERHHLRHLSWSPTQLT